MPLDPMFVEHDKHTWLPHAGLFDVYVRRGDWNSATESGKRALDFDAPAHFQTRYARFQKDHTKYASQKIAVLVDRGQMDFIQPVIEDWLKCGKEVVTATEVGDIDELLAWEPDLIWCEWGGPLAAEVTKRNPKARVIVRLHGYEVYNHLVEDINWLAVDSVIAVSRQLLGDFIKACPIVELACRLHVVHGGVAEPGEIGTRGDGKQIAMLGYVNDRKNIPLALQILAMCPEHTLHIAGEWQSDELRIYTEHMARELGVADRLKIYGRVEDKWEFLKDKDFILSTSTRETFHYAIAEGMMCGLTPVIHGWPSAGEFYPEECIFNSVDDAAKLLEAERSVDGWAHWHDYASEHLCEAKMLRRIKRIVDKPVVAVCGNPKYAHSTEYDLGHALERIGCTVEGDKPDAVILMGYKPVIEPWMDGIPKLWWQMELCVGDSPKAVSMREAMKDVVQQVDVVASTEPDWAEVCRQIGAKRVEVVRNIGACPPWRKLDISKMFDIGFYGAMTERRERILEVLGEKFDIHVFEPYDHDEANVFVNSCKVMLNLRAYDELYTQCRPAECMAAGARIVSEPMGPDHLYPSDCYMETGEVEASLRFCLDPDNEHIVDSTAKRGHKWIWSKRPYELVAEELLEVLGL
jgi:glycosyltransferase involved in cell wall biosynthesis